jgi:hypothetical protein
MQGQNARAGGKASKEVTAGPVSSQIECSLLYFYVIFANMSTAVSTVFMKCRVVQVIIHVFIRSASLLLP